VENFIILGLCIVLLIVLILFYIKDRQTDAKFARFDQLLTDNMQENFLLKKEIDKINGFLDELPFDEMGDIIDQEIDRKLLPIVKNLQGINDIINKK